MLSVGSEKVQWEEVLVEGEFQHVTDSWAKMVATRKPLTIQTKVTKLWKTPELDAHGSDQWTDTHLLLSLYPDLDDDGEVLTIMSCITDIR